MMTDEEYWERWLASPTKLDQWLNAEQGRPAMPREFGRAFGIRLSAAPLARMRTSGFAQDVDSLSWIDPRLLTERDVVLLGLELREMPAYGMRFSLLLLVSRAPSPSSTAFGVLRDYFWQVDASRDPEPNSERFMCWSGAMKHASVQNIPDLLQAVVAREHTTARAVAILTLARFKRQADLFREVVRGELEDHFVAPECAEVLAKIGDVEAIPLIKKALVDGLPHATNPKVFEERIVKALKTLGKKASAVKQ